MYWLAPLLLLPLAGAGAQRARREREEGAKRRAEEEARRARWGPAADGFGGGSSRIVQAAVNARIDTGAFWSQMQSGVDVWKDVMNGVIKSIVFGVAVTLIALFEGWQARPTPEGVARATTRTVVAGSLAVLGLDFLLTALMFSN